MTITGEQRSRVARRNVAAGKATERMVAGYLTAHLGVADPIVRAVRTGTTTVADPGDLARLPGGMIVSVKYASVKPSDGRIRIYPNEWLAELDAMDGPDEAVRFLVVRMPRLQITTWPVFVRAAVFASIMMVAGFGPIADDPAEEPNVIIPWARRVLATDAPEPIRVPVRVELAPWVRMLVSAGFDGQQER
jgi:hypothetical protein